MATRGGDDNLHFDGTADFSQARKTTNDYLKQLQKLGDQAQSTGKAIDKTTTDSSKGYRQLALDIAKVIKAEDDLTKSAAQARQARSQAQIVGANAKVATGTVGARVTQAGAQADLAVSKVITERAERLTKIRQQQNRDLESQSRIALNNDRRQAIADQAHTQQLQRQAALKAESDRNYEQTLRFQESNLKKQAQQQQRIHDAEQKALEKERALRVRQEEKQNSLSTTNSNRYALYDVAQTAAIVGTAVASIGAFSVITAIQFEDSFSNVQRSAELTGDQVGAVRDQIVDLSTEIKSSFENLTIAATLGAQMDIAANDLDKFSEVTTKFSATTNASIDTTAQSFGRIGNLLDVPATEFENLGSAIYDVGIKSVATETEILSTSQQIAGAASAYNFTAQEVVGLGAAFASLAIAPEAARGSVTRIFGDIEKSVAAGGPALEEYARLMQLSVEETASLWKTDPGTFFTELVQGLSQSKSLLSDLNAIGANDVRDVNLLQRLAGNPEILVNSIKISNDAYAEGTALSDAYGVTAETLASKLQILVQTFQALAASGGGPLLEILKPVVDLVTDFLNRLREVPALAIVVSVLTLIVGGFILMKGATAAAMAGLLAIQTVFKSLEGQIAITGINLRSFNALLLQTKAVAGVGTTSVATFDSKVRSAGAGLLTFAKGAGVLAAITVGLSLVTAGAEDLNAMFDTSQQKAEKYFGDLTGFSDAIEKDTAVQKAYEEQVKKAQAAGLPIPKDATGTLATFTAKLEETAPAMDNAADSASNFLGVQSSLEGSVKSATSAIDEQSYALGENYSAQVRKLLSEQDGIIALANDPALVEAFTAMGGNIGDFIAAGAKGGAQDYLDGILDDARDKVQEALNAGGPTGQLDLTPELQGLQTTVQQLETYLGPAASASDSLAQSFQETANTSSLLGAGLDAAGGDTEGLEEKMSNLQKQVDATFSTMNTQADFGASLRDLYMGIEEGDKSFSAFTVNGAANLENLQGSIVATANYAQTIGGDVTESLVSLFASLQQQGVDTDSLLRQLANNPVTFEAGLDVTAVQAGLAAIGAGNAMLSPQQIVLNDLMSQQADYAKRASAAQKSYGGSAAKSAKEVRTLSDYVSDLGKLMKDAMEFRFGRGNALDEIRNGWEAIAEAQREAKRQLKEYLVEMQGLKDDRSMLQFQLSVAVAYGDTFHEEQIRAKLAETNQDIADKQRDINEATKAGNKTLKGNSQVARDNRAELYDLMGSYQDYILTIKNSSLSQKEQSAAIKIAEKDFFNQAKQLGYNNAELKIYRDSFNDVNTIIRKLPKNLTLKANTDPAQRALDEFSKKNTGGKGISKGFTAPVSFKFNDNALAKFARGNEIAADIAKYQKIISTTRSDATLEHYSDLIEKLSKKLNSGNYYNGGFVPWAKSSNGRDNGTGVLPGGRTVGLDGGEPIINNRARSKYGDKMFMDINSMKFKPQVSVQPIIQMAAPVGSGSGGTDTMMILRAMQNMQLKVYMDGKEVTGVVNSHNEHTTRRGQ